MDKKAVLYARVSSDDTGKNDRNLDGQSAMCREYALSCGYEIVVELREDDRGASGASFELAQLSKIIDMAHNHEFDVLVVREIDRLSRNLAKQLVIEETLTRYGVQIDYVIGSYENNPEGNFMKHVRATVAEYEREKIKERMVRGKGLMVKAGSVMPHGKAAYGYRVVGEPSKQWRLEIYEPEAEKIRMIFDLYINGENGEDIGEWKLAERLTKIGIPTFFDIHPESGGLGKKSAYGIWSAATIGHILKNETYCGIWHYGKQRKVGTGKWEKVPTKNLPSVEVPAIISRETWEAAQQRMMYNRDHSLRNLKYDVYLLRRRVCCGSCGAKMALRGQIWGGKRFGYFHCPSSNNHYVKPCDNHTCFRSDILEAIVWDWVKHILTDPASLQEGLDEYRAEHDKENVPLRERLKVIDGLIAENTTKLARLVDLYLENEFTKDALLEKKVRLETNIRALENERAAVLSQLQARVLTPDEIRDLYDFANRIAKGLNNIEDDLPAKREIIEAINLKVTLAVEDGERVAYIRSILGNTSMSVITAAL